MASIVRGTSVVLSVALAVLVAACGSSSSTGPTPPSASAETLHLDSLWAAYGAAPSFYAVDLNGTKQTWTGVALDAASDGDSEAITILWDDANADNIFISEIDYNGASADTNGGIIAADTIGVDLNTLSVTTARVSTGSGTTCTLQAGLQDTQLTNLFGGDTPACSSIVQSTTVSATSTPPAGAEAGLASVSYSNSKATGEYFLDATDPLHVPSRALAARKLHALFLQLHATLRRR
jgi:hypothetical protein